jgi:hypothetical protein
MKLIQDETRPGHFGRSNPWVLWAFWRWKILLIDGEMGQIHENPLENGHFSIKANFMDFPPFSITENHRTCSDQQESRESSFNQCTLVKQ